MRTLPRHRQHAHPPAPPAWRRCWRRLPANAGTICLLFGLCAIAHGFAAAQTCGAAPGGPPGNCSDSSAASTGNGSPSAGAGNPINVITGNKYQREDDLPALPGVLGLEIVRHYNSAYSKPNAPNGAIGRGWRLSYETEVFDQNGRIQVLQADGGRVIFTRDPNSPDLCSTALPANGRMTLSRQADGSVAYDWTWRNGRRLHFNSRGKLERIAAPTGETVDLRYDSDNLLTRVTDPQGRSLSLAYLDRRQARANDRFRGVQHIDSPVGRFSYEYGSAPPSDGARFDTRALLANLLRVHLPTGYDATLKAHSLTSRGSTTSNASRYYHHDDPRFPWLLTGISIETTAADGKSSAARLATFAYDSNGRANLSTHANNVGKVTLDSSEGGKTILTNSLGQRTVYRHAIIGGQHRVLEVRGAGCAACSDANVRYRYDKLGQLLETVTLDTNGVPLASIFRELDWRGRVVRLSRTSYRNGKPGQTSWLLRTEYRGADVQPSVIARPSVVPGKEVQTRITYNKAGQPLLVTEAGWIPTFDGRQAAAQLERTTAYRYASINGRSLLVSIDGPLPNGKTNSPQDSDMTVFEYDRRTSQGAGSTAEAGPGALLRYEGRDGLLSRVIAPGDLVTEILERDEALRPATLRIADGDITRVVSIRSNWRGAPEYLIQSAGAIRRETRYAYNADGTTSAILHPGGLRTVYQHDPAGRLRRAILADGSGLALQQDTEDRMESIARHEDFAPTEAGPLSTLRFQYQHWLDRPSQLGKIGDALGPIKSYSYNTAGQAAAIANALGTTAMLAYDTEGLLSTRTDAAGSTDTASLRLAYDNAGRAIHITAPNGVATLRRYDDFGRKVFEADPDHGATVFRHDAADRLIARIDETMATTRYTYDHAGRLIAVGKDHMAKLLQYRYRGSRLVGMLGTPDGTPEHATERLDQEYDAMGQPVRETRWLAAVDAIGAGGPANGLRFVTTSAFDEAGRLIRQTLPDGHVLQYRYTPAGAQPKNGKRRAGQLEAILFDNDVIVDGIEQSIAGGMTGYTMGNGIRQQAGLDARGRIVQLNAVGNTLPSAWWRRAASWFTAGKPAAGRSLYSQKNRYDPAGRLVRIDKTLAPSGDKQAAVARQENYSYDRMDRIKTIAASDGTDTTFDYDAAGNRTGESGDSSQWDIEYAAIRPRHAVRQKFSYAHGGNWLLAATQQPSETAAALSQAAWFYHPTGVPLAQLQWRDKSTSNRRTVYNSDKRPIAVYDNDRLGARYHYNTLGERIAKTVYPSRPAARPVPVALQAATRPTGDTSYSLYREQRLAADTDAGGRITAHYIYLYGKPVAKIEMTPNTNPVRPLWKAVTRGDDAGDRVAHIYAITTDHLGTPQQVTDARQRVVWQAVTAPFGEARVVSVAKGADGKPFTMNLRLPGQVYDAETRLHYNYLRDYDPALGRYLAPDPLGHGAGVNPYAYVGNNPLTNVDPLGLYQEDVHYYMTFFLAITAGVDKDVARQIALAAQYIDDNPVTEPMLPDGIKPDSVLINQPALERYHFVQAGYDKDRDFFEKWYHSFTAHDLQSYIERRIGDPASEQLKLLLNASKFAKTDPNATCNSSAQLFGEYLHAFEDTFAHRDQENNPYTATTLDLGLGHLSGMKNPDLTYNHGSWKNNEARTLQMEKEVFEKMKAFSNPLNRTYSFDAISYTLKVFNETKASAGEKNFAKKIEILNKALNYLGYKDIDIRHNEGKDSYNEKIAAENRSNSLNRLNPQDYVGTILPRGTAPLPEKKNE